MKVLRPPDQDNARYEIGQTIDMEIENRLMALRFILLWRRSYLITQEFRSTKPVLTKPIVRVMSISKPDEDEETAVRRIINQTVNEGNLLICHSNVSA